MPFFKFGRKPPQTPQVVPPRTTQQTTTQAQAQQQRPNEFLKGLDERLEHRAGDFEPGDFAIKRKLGQVPEPTKENRDLFLPKQFGSAIRLQLFQKREAEHEVNRAAALSLARQFCRPPLTPEILLDRVISHLQDAPLKTNFSMARFDYEEFAKTGRYQNCFAPHLDGPSHKNDYMQRRNAIEENLFDLPALYGKPEYGRAGQYVRGFLGRLN